MSSGIAYPMPTYIPPLPVFNPIFFPQSFGTTTTSGGGGGQTNIFPNGLTSGNVITLNGGTGGGGGTGVERTITGISYLDFVDSSDTDPTNITGYITLNGNTLEIGSLSNSTGINVNLQGTTISANGVAIGGGGDVFLAGNNTFTGTNDFQANFTVDNALTNIGQYTSNNTGIGFSILSNISTGSDNTAFGHYSLSEVIDGQNNTAVGSSALTNITSGESNTGLGYASLSSSLTDNNNTAVGYWSGQQLNGGDNNTFIGYESGYNQITGSNNLAIGFQSGVDLSQQNLSNTIAIGNQITAVETGEIILGFGDYNNSGATYFAKYTPLNTNDGVQLQCSYNNAQNFTINSTGHSINLEGTIINLNGVGSGLTTDGVNVLNGMSINGGTLNTSDKASQPVLGALYCSYYSYGGVPFYAFSDSGGTTTHEQLATTSSLSSYAPLDSPTFTGIPTAPTALSTDNSTQLATTAFVQSVVGGGSNILGTYTSSPCNTSLSPTGWEFDTIIPNTLGNQFSFIIYSNTAPTNTSSPYFTNNILSTNQVSDYILAVGTAILIPYQYSNNGAPPVITNTSGYLFTAPTSIGGLRFSSVVINPTSNGMTYLINATSTTENPITNGSTLTLVAYNSYF